MSGVLRVAVVRRALTLGVLGGVLIVTSLAGCGLPTMSEPAAIDQAAVPTPAAQGPQSDSVVPGGTAELYFVSGEHMVRAVRRAPVAGNAAQVIELTLAQLVSGPDETERSAGLSSAIPPGLTLRLVKLSGGLAVVDIVGTDPGPAADQAHLATGQVVLTLTALPQVDSVMLTRNGRPLEAALPDGELTALPLTARDFTVLVQH